MPGPQLESVPNVSEGRDLARIDAMTEAIRAVPGVRLLHRDIGFDANRTVFTFVGSAAPVLAAARALATTAVHHIDLRHYSGTHPYIGALDVCPFVPLWGFDPAEAHAVARAMGQFLFDELRVPVYFYEKSSSRDLFRSLAAVRKGGISAIAGRAPEMGPDLGGLQPHPSAGYSVVGVRDILVAYNINVPNATLAEVQLIARHLRQLPAVRAIGWLQPSYGLAQVSVNLLDYRITGLATVYEQLRSTAAGMGLAPQGSELIGMLPLEALLDAARSYDLPAEASESSAIALAVERLGLSALRPFVAEERILEMAIGSGRSL